LLGKRVVELKCNWSPSIHTRTMFAFRNQRKVCLVDREGKEATGNRSYWVNKTTGEYWIIKYTASRFRQKRDDKSFNDRDTRGIVFIFIWLNEVME
jgi:hypothetical protein